MVSEELEYLTNEDILKKEFEYYKKTPGRLSGFSNRNEIVKFFQQDNFYIYEKNLWKDENIRKKIIENRVKYLNKTEEELTDNDILTGFKKSGIHYGYSHFNPLIFKWFIEKYNVKRCYDPCGGWGHRLIGAQDLELYIYNDISYNTACACQDIANYFDMENVEWFNEDARECSPGYLFKFDSIFTCPPYFNLEHYDCGDFESYEDWAGIIDVMHIEYDIYDFVKTMGIVLREDLLPKWHNDYTEKFEIPTRKSEHLLKNIEKQNKEYLYIWKKEN